MEMTNVVAPAKLLEDQHHEIDRALLEILYGRGEISAHLPALRLLVEHIYVEEQILFPLLENAGVIMPTENLNREHGEMWPYIQKLIAAATSGTLDRVAVRELCARLYEGLQTHNHKEEDLVYTAITRVVEADGGRALSASIESVEVPAGWACAFA